MENTRTFKALKRSAIACTVASLAAFTVAPAVADQDIADSLTACRAIENDSERLVCYDNLAATGAPGAPVAGAATTSAAVSSAPAAVTAERAPDPAVSAESTPAPLTDDVGKEQIKGSKVRQPEYTAAVTRCEKSSREHRMYFYMDNGQIWSQSNVGRLRFREKSCQFEVVITKDGFGWFMSIPSENRKVRVRRVR